MTDAPSTPSTRRYLGTLLVRVIVPLWVLTGALFKLIEGNPKLLPRDTILRPSQQIARQLQAQLDFDLLLASLISLEFLAVAVMVFIARLARPMAIFVLGAFCLVLVGEIAAGNTSCGCLGAYSPNPLVMLAIDGALLLGVILFKPLGALRFERSSWPVLAALAFVAITSFTSFTVLTRDTDRTATTLTDRTDDAGPAAPDLSSEQTAGTEEQPQPDLAAGEGVPDSAAAADPDSPQVRGAGPPAPAGGAVSLVNPSPKALPKHWFEGDFSTWEGKSWREVELFQFMKKWPKGLDQGKRYVVFYSRTCDHCEEMFRNDLALSPELARQVTAVRVPDEVDQWNRGDAWEMPETEVEHLELPMGANWIITTPLSLRVEDGIIRCAEEAGHTRCLELE